MWQFAFVIFLISFCIVNRRKPFVLREMMDKKAPKIIIVTTAYHVFRALILARQQRIKCVGFDNFLQLALAISF